MSFIHEERTIVGGVFQKNGAQIIKQAIAGAQSQGKTQCVISGNYEIEDTVLLPSNFTLILEDCHLRMADNTFCNMFSNANHGKSVDYNIRLIGRGRAILDGGNYNGLSESNSLKDGNPHISVNNLLLFANVEEFVVSDIQCRNQRWWALNFIACRFGRIQNIDFHADDTVIFADGSRRHGIFRQDFKEKKAVSAHIRNADGVDIRCGCHDILIQNITGFTEDDSVAITGLLGWAERTYLGDNPTDIYNITVRDVNTTTNCGNVRLLNRGGIKLYNILVDGVMDSAHGSVHADKGSYAVRIGDAYAYSGRDATKDETYNIVVRNIYSSACSVVDLNGEITNLTVENIHACKGAGEWGLLMNNATLYGDCRIEEVKNMP